MFNGSGPQQKALFGFRQMSRKVDRPSGNMHIRSVDR